MWGSRRNDLYNLASRVTLHQFPNILWVTQVSVGETHTGRDQQEARLPGAILKPGYHMELSPPGFASDPLLLFTSSLSQSTDLFA